MTIEQRRAAVLARIDADCANARANKAARDAVHTAERRAAGFTTADDAAMVNVYNAPAPSIVSVFGVTLRTR